FADASHPPAVTERPASSCIMGSIGVKAKRPIPIAIASATSPATAITTGDALRADVSTVGKKLLRPGGLHRLPRAYAIDPLRERRRISAPPDFGKAEIDVVERDRHREIAQVRRRLAGSRRAQRVERGGGAR